MNLRMISSLIIIVGLSCSLVSCNDSDNPLENQPNNNESSSLHFWISNIPNGVSQIRATIERDDFEPRTQLISVDSNSVRIYFSNLAEGEWLLKVNALDNNGIVIYSGQTKVNIINGQTTKAFLNLSPTSGGALEVLVTWGEDEYQVFYWNFDSGILEGWGGPAGAEIVDNTLHIFAANAYKYHSISNIPNQHFRKGIIEYDFKPGEGSYSFETKGATAGSHQHNWGIYLKWKDGTIQINQWKNSKRVLENTGVAYEKKLWYHIRIEFDNDKGTKGKYSLWIKPLIDGSKEIFVGEFDYLAEYGKLIGVVEFVLGAYDSEKITPRNAYYDNLFFKVYPS